MFTYKVNVKKISGRLNESVLPSKSLVIKSKKPLSKKALLKEASKFYKKNYNLVVESIVVDEMNRVTDVVREFCENYHYEIEKLYDLVNGRLVEGLKDGDEESLSWRIDSTCTIFEKLLPKLKSLPIDIEKFIAWSKNQRLH